MASVRSLKTEWHIRYYDASCYPEKTTDSLSKADYTEREAEKEAEVYPRGCGGPRTFTLGGTGPLPCRRA